VKVIDIDIKRISLSLNVDKLATQSLGDRFAIKVNTAYGNFEGSSTVGHYFDVTVGANFGYGAKRAALVDAHVLDAADSDTVDFNQDLCRKTRASCARGYRTSGVWVCHLFLLLKIYQPPSVNSTSANT